MAFEMVSAVGRMWQKEEVAGEDRIRGIKKIARPIGGIANVTPCTNASRNRPTKRHQANDDIDD